MKLKFFIAIFITVVIASTSFAGETWKITSLDWQPYSGSDMATEGNSVQKLRQLLKSENIDLLVDFFPWLRAKYNAKKKDYIGYFPAWPEEVDEGFIASPPIDWSEVAVFKQTGSEVEFDSIDDMFKKYKVGVVRTYIYPQEIDDAMTKYPHHVDNAPHEVSLLKKLSAGRHLVAITDPNVMLYVASRHGVSNIEIIEGFSIKKELVIAFRNNEENKRRIDLLKKILAKP